VNAVTEDVSAETAAEYLRLAVPLMSRHRVPPTPDNYAVWYNYVCGENAALNAEVDRLSGEHAAFTPALCGRLHREFVAERDIGDIEQVRSGLTRILLEVAASLSEAEHDAHAFEGRLGGIAVDVGQRSGLGDIRRLLATLLEETRAMQQAASGMQAHFEAKSREIEELKEQLQRERKRAVTDPLTGLNNRFALFEQLGAAIGETAGGQPPSLIMLDIDHFKQINDSHGHLIGDRVVRFVAQVLQQNIKGRDIAARFGGDELAILLPATGPRGAEALAQAICRAVGDAQLVRSDDKTPLGRITLSAGVACYRPGEALMALVDRADQALYRAKKAGRNRVCVG
jgi:diguanylate cyclase